MGACAPLGEVGVSALPWSAWGVASIGVVYVVIGLVQALKGNLPGATTWLAYGVANFGLMWEVK